MRIRFEMSMRNELPEVLKRLYEAAGRSVPDRLQEHREPIGLMRKANWPFVPGAGELVWLGVPADPVNDSGGVLGA